MADYTLTPPTDDACVKESDPGANFGAETTTRFAQARDTSRNIRGFAKWDLSSLAGKTIKAATAKLYVTTHAEGGTYSIDVWRCAADWAEGTITWNNQPAVTGAIVGSVAETGLTAGWWSWTLDPAQMNALLATNYGLRWIYNPENTGYDFIECYMTENGSSMPTLEIDVVKGGAMWWFSSRKWKHFLEDLKRGLLPPDVLKRCYGELLRPI